MSSAPESLNSFDLLVLMAVGSAEFRRKLIADPAAAVTEAGGTLPAGARLIVHEDTPHEVNLVLRGQTIGLPAEALELFKKADQDAGFKSRLLADPVTTARAEIGVVLPASLKVSVHENSATAVHVALPIAESPDAEMSDLELEAVSGGKGIGSIFRRFGGRAIPGILGFPPGSLKGHNFAGML
ncbi:MAG: NHLP leader peptide family natural product precursor [Planctomycetia bacterium]|nr:NHLP leader peptide family natural product precursor [Planctomycetia bacterium]